MDLDSNFDELPASFPPEPQVGNIEYKLKIVNPSKQRFEHLVTQMKWRLREGQGEAIYEIGIEDNGNLVGVSNVDLQSSLNTLRKMAVKLGASIHVLREKQLPEDKKLAEVLVRKVPDDQDNIEIRIAVLGNASAGKSTLLGLLTHGELDNGKGKTRLNMFRHLHEIQSGRTSSISHEILGFNSQGDAINYGTCGFMTAEEICEASSKMVTFLDLAGHKKYINTTVQGMSGYAPHYAMLVISSDAGAIGMTHEHLTIAIALKVPYFLVITKTDIIPPSATINTLDEFFKEIGVRKIPVVIHSLDDVITAGRLHLKQDVIPIFCVSNVNGDGIKMLLKFLHILSPGISLEDKQRFDQEAVEFQIDENCTAGNINQILGGLLLRGVITERTKLKIGPRIDGNFMEVEVKSIHRNKVPCRVVKSGQSAAICLDKEVSDLRNGMVLLSQDVEACGCFYFQATISLLFSSSPLYPGSETTAHINSIRQTVVIVGIFIGNCLHSNETSSVMFKFKQHPEYIRPGQRLLLRDGISRGIGEVTQVFPLNTHSK